MKGERVWSIVTYSVGGKDVKYGVQWDGLGAVWQIVIISLDTQSPVLAPTVSKAVKPSDKKKPNNPSKVFQSSPSRFVDLSSHI